ncbi:Pentraxin fusion protein [Collichthys lucidus]|uniref:Pentraxin family member n=1 Tax=Collichthys lucidus TaxID=240159 RepID=A0A4U5VTN3_COLLU|nr:Pentraxin fusion protein [Collichthys lucidus]
MRLSVVLFLIAISAVLAGSVTIKSLVFPTETSTSYVGMTPKKPMTLNAFTLCMRVATELPGERETILFAYRTSYYDELNVWRELDGSLSFALAGGTVKFQVPPFSALQSHLCITWDSSSGASTVFMDGRKSLTKTYKQGHTIQPNGKVIIGQDPDNYLGEFDAKQSFVGEMCDINMWDSVLSDSTINDLFTGKRVPRGNVLDWETAEFEVQGQAQVVDRELYL